MYKTLEFPSNAIDLFLLLKKVLLATVINKGHHTPESSGVFSAVAVVVVHTCAGTVDATVFGCTMTDFTVNVAECNVFDNCDIMLGALNSFNPRTFQIPSEMLFVQTFSLISQ